MPRLPIRAAVLVVAAALGGCTAPYLAPLGQQNGQTAALENADRINRFARLSALGGVAPPLVEQLVAYPGQQPGLFQPVPVVRVQFDEDSMFASGSDRLRPETGAAMDLLADSMRRDVPDAQLTLLGHTDATGSDALNNGLSMRRAQAVFQALVDRGVNAGQLSTVAIGKYQPVASNQTAAGRARNRRVEFLISAALEANLAVVQQRPVNAAFLASAEASRAPSRVAASGALPRVAVLKTTTYSGPADFSEAAPNGKVRLQEAGTIELSKPPAKS